MNTKSQSILEQTSRTIRVSYETYSDLSKHGTFGDSFDTVIRRLLVNEEKTEQVLRGNGEPIQSPQNQPGRHDISNTQHQGVEVNR